MPENVEKAKRKVIFLGSNPAMAGDGQPFSNCKSGDRLREWIAYLGLKEEEVVFFNVSDEKTPGNRPLKKAEVLQKLPQLADKIKSQGDEVFIITLGKTALDAVYELYRKKTVKFVFASLYHPSGRNRKLNDAREVLDKLDKIKRFLDS